jgi:hypothetical protein
MLWEISHRADPRARYVADRHYSRQKAGTQQFVPPGRCLVLYARTKTGQAYWTTSWPYGDFVKHDWPGAWVCSAFRNESAGLSSALIQQAVAASIWRWGNPPREGMVTFVDASKVKPPADGKSYGYCFLKAGFKPIGKTKGGLLAFHLPPDDMPPGYSPLFPAAA